MSTAPYLLPKMRGGARIGHAEVKDHMFLDGLEDAYDKGRLMGTFAEDCAERYQLTREAQDDYALASLSRALQAQDSGAFKAEIAPVTVRGRSTGTVIDADEQPARARPDKIPQLKPAFRPGGTVTAANASSISDGAAALVLASEKAAAAQGLRARARIVGHAGHAQEPGWFTTAPIPAAPRTTAPLTASAEVRPPSARPSTRRPPGPWSRPTPPDRECGHPRRPSHGRRSARARWRAPAAETAHRA